MVDLVDLGFGLILILDFNIVFTLTYLGLGFNRASDST
jgi:hypothetical protein